LDITDIIPEIELCLNHVLNWTSHKVFHILIVKLFRQGNREVNFDNGLVANDPIEVDDEYHFDEVMGSVEINDKVTDLGK
jgi:hypothetical protein